MPSRAPSSVGSSKSGSTRATPAGSQTSTRSDSPAPGPRPVRNEPPQKTIDTFWSNYNTKYPGKVWAVLPNDLATKHLSPRSNADIGIANAADSYNEAAEICRAKVDKIVKECRRVNQKYRDPYFDIETEFYDHSWPDCLHGLLDRDDDVKLEPKSVKRVADIFEKPRFFVDGATANDVRQGRNGDCWLMSAICTITGSPALIERVCVARDEQVGVYGFVFYRDGGWISEVVDDKLFLVKEDYVDHDGTVNEWLELQESKDLEGEYKKRFQTGSKALYFGQCSHPNETWLPLLEKGKRTDLPLTERTKTDLPAFAKCHGDYLAIEGGYVGEAIEDLTGGVTSEVSGTDILDKDQFWQELLQANKQFLFGCGAARGQEEQRKGILARHAYSIIEAREVDGKRLVKLRNPWGNTEWSGPWSDGSEEWTPEWMQKLDHRFGDDGVFWIAYEDLLHAYRLFDRTRLFDEVGNLCCACVHDCQLNRQTWNVCQQWISLDIPWSIDYLDTSFVLDVSGSGPVVIVLSQLDDRYFRGLEGQYDFKLHFRLHKQGEADDLVRSPSSYYVNRSVSTEVDLEPGKYSVMLKIIATMLPYRMPVDQVISQGNRLRMQKLHTIGLNYDVAHAKVDFRAIEREKEETETAERRAKRKADAKAAYQAGQKARSKARDLRQKTAAKLAAKRQAAEQTEESETADDDQEAEEHHDDVGSQDSNAGPENPDSASENELSWNSELHAPSDTDDEGDNEDETPDNDQSDDAEPWNAVCVVGLRVYSKVGNEVKISVSKPGGDVDEEERGEDQEQVGELELEGSPDGRLSRQSTL